MQDTTKRQQAAAARELAVFREAAGFAPRRQVLEDVVDAIGQVGRRLGRPAEAEDLKPFVRAWARRGWRMDNLAWLTDWAVNGAVPGRAPTRTGTVAHGNDTGTGDSIRLVRNNVSAEERQRLIRFYNGLPDG